MVDDKTIDAASRFVETLKSVFGPTGIWVILILGLIAAIGFKLYNDYQRSKREGVALDAKDETIAILVEQNRDFRVKIARIDGWSDEMISEIILKKSPQDAIEAQKLLDK